MTRQAHERPAPERIHASLDKHERMATDDLRYYRGNAKQHDLPDLRSKLRTHGQVDELLVNRGTYTGRPNEVLSGNGRLEVMREDGWLNVAVRVVDLDEQTATKWVLMLNPPEGREPGHDKRLLLELLATLDDTEGSGYGAEHVMDLEQEIAGETGHPDEDPLPIEGDADVDDLEITRTVVITCLDEGDQQEILELSLRNGWSATAVTR